MQTETATISERVARYSAALKEAGVKLTHQRSVIMEEVARAENHPDADSVFRAVRLKVPTCSLDTVYRTLQLMQELKLIQVVSAGGERMRFDANELPHHHFICGKCGTVYDFYSEGFDRMAIPDEVRRLGNVEGMQVEIRGICKECLKQEQGR